MGMCFGVVGPTVVGPWQVVVKSTSMYPRGQIDTALSAKSVVGAAVTTVGCRSCNSVVDKGGEAWFG